MNRVQKIKETILNYHSISEVKASLQVKRHLAIGKSDWENQIAKRIESKHPLLFGRLGGLEAQNLAIFLDLESGWSKPLRKGKAKLFHKRRLKQLCHNAGVYPENRKSFEFFCLEHLNALENLDIFSVWAKPFAWVENLFLDDSVLSVDGRVSFPWLEARDGISRNGWGHSLANKKVLVVSPFVDSMSAQVDRLSLVFPDIFVPQFDFLFLKAPLTQGGLHDGRSYESYLREMKDSLNNLEFDVALISAGAYSLPLAAQAKLQGKKGIHAGGALQLFFGIIGRRYEDDGLVRKFLNEYWKRPYEHERPKNWQKIEGGCYW